jgi:hypothetical protein
MDGRPRHGAHPFATASELITLPRRDDGELDGLVDAHRREFGVASAVAVAHVESTTPIVVRRRGRSVGAGAVVRVDMVLKFF